MTHHIGREFVEVIVPLDFNYNIRVGKPIEEYLRGMGEKKIMGSRCSECGKVVVPPRKVCSVSCGDMEIVEVPQTGIVQNYTVAHVKMNKGLLEPLEEPIMLALVQLDGTQSLLPAEIRGVKPEDLKVGLKVRAVWKDAPEGTYSDLDHFEPSA